LDPPFNSKANYNVIFKTPKKEDSPSQIQAFEDTWKWNSTTEFELHQLFGSEPKLAELMKGLELIIGKNDLLAYLVMMAIRLRELHRVLKDTGSLYLHCDPTASHYLKLVLDSIFGIENFRNEIIWKRTTAHGNSKQGSKNFSHIHDVILRYSKTQNYIWNTQHVPFSDEQIKQQYNKIDENGRKYRLVTPTAAKGGGDVEYEFHGVKPPKGRYWAYTKKNLEKMFNDDLLYFSKPG